MTGTQIRNYATILIALVVLVLILQNPFGRGGPSPEKLALFPGYQSDQVDRIQVVDKGATIELERRAPGDWVIVRDYPLPADTSSIHRALESVASFSKQSRVSRNPDKHAIFEVSDSAGARVELYAGDDEPIARFILGKSTRSGGTYFRPVGQDDVFESGKRIKSFFVKNDERSWQNRRIFAEEPSKFSRLSIERGDSTIVFETDPDSNWFLKEPEEFQVKKEAVESMLNGVCRLFASSLVDSAVTGAVTGLDTPLVKVRAERLDGRAIELLIGKQGGDGLHYCKAGDRDWVYQIARYRVDSFYKDPTEMKAEPPPEPPAPPAEPEAPAKPGEPAPAGGGAKAPKGAGAGGGSD